MLWDGLREEVERLVEPWVARLDAILERLDHVIVLLDGGDRCAWCGHERHWHVAVQYNDVTALGACRRHIRPPAGPLEEGDVTKCPCEVFRARSER